MILEPLRYLLGCIIGSKLLCASRFNVAGLGRRLFAGDAVFVVHAGNISMRSAFARSRLSLVLMRVHESPVFLGVGRNVRLR